MRALIDQLFGSDGEKAEAAEKALDNRGVTSAADANAILGALAREVKPIKGVYLKPKHALLAAIQSCEVEQARTVFKKEGAQAIIAAYSKLGDDEKTFGLKILALLGSKEALAFIADRIKEENGPKDFMISVALGAINPKTPHVDVLFPALAPVLAYSDFRAVAVLDLASQLALAGSLKRHPGADQLDKLRGFIASKDEGEFSYAHSACLALAFIPGAAAEKLLVTAEDHPDSNVRLEATYALARRDHPGSDKRLAKAALNPATSQRAIEYLKEIGKAQLVPGEVNDPLFAAKAEMLSWLAHPMEYGRPPESIELWDRRTIYWPPTDDKREFFLFKYTYPPKRAGEAADVGVGLVGSTTFSLFGETRPAPEGTPEDALAAHCVWELEGKGDPRGKGRKIEVGRKLLGFKTAKQPP